MECILEEEEEKKNACICYQTLLCCINGEIKKKKERTHCLETTINERTLTHLKKKTTKKTRSLCMLRRQGIGFDLK